MPNQPPDDRDRWNRRYSAGEHSSGGPSQVLVDLSPFLPSTGRALDVAGGAGRNSLWLARNGWQVTLADISDVALDIARQRAHADGLALSTIQVDLERGGLPAREWQLIVCVHFLHRPLLRTLAQHLSPDGVFVMVHPTVFNLERHAKPPERFLLQPGELPDLIGKLRIMHFEEDWTVEGRHEAVLVARAADKRHGSPDASASRRH